MALRRAVRGLWAGEVGLFGFVDMMNSAIRLHFNNAWYEGAKSEGIEADELSPSEISIRDDMANSEMLYVMDFGRAILAGDKESGGSLQPYLDRAELWASRYDTVMMRAKLLAARDKKKKWVFGDTKHCDDCARLHGRVYRASVWEKHGLRPKSADLQCFGVHCQCNLEDTDEPLTKGRPPKLIGRRWGLFNKHHHHNSTHDALTGD